jgi:hypothetical protein
VEEHKDPPYIPQFPDLAEEHKPLRSSGFNLAEEHKDPPYVPQLLDLADEHKSLCFSRI